MEIEGLDVERLAPEGAGRGETTSARLARLAAATSRVRTREGARPERVLQLVSWFLLPLGAALILLGWYGAARTTREWQQTPYLISGGLLGLGLMFTGGFAYFAYWVTKLVDEGREQAAQAAELAERTAAALERIESLLAGTTGDDVSLVSTPSGTMVHRADCPMVVGKPSLRPVPPDGGGLRPCLVCRPDVAAPNGSGVDRPAGRPRRRAAR